MSPRMRILLTLLIATWLASDVSAQPPGGPGGGGPGFGGPPPGMFGGDKLMLLAQKSVQDELQITDKQQKQIDQRLKKQRETFESLREMTPEDAQRKLAKQSRTNDSALSKLLTAAQYKRLGQISLQQRGPRALADADVAKVLALSGPQKKQVQQIQAEAQEQMRTEFAGFAPRAGGGPGGGPAGGPGFPGPSPGGQRPDGRGAAPAPPGQEGPGGAAARGGPTEAQQQAMRDVFKKMDALRQKTDEQLLAVLKSQQQAKWQEMQGEPFKAEFRFPGPPRGPRGDGEGPPADDGAPPRRGGPPGKGKRSVEKQALAE